MIVTFLWILLLGSCAYFDLKQGKIPNRCTVLLAVVGCLVYLSDGRIKDCLLSCVLATVILLLGYLFGYRTGGLGGGDVKLLSAALIFLQGDKIGAFLLASLILALIMGVIKILSGRKHTIRMAVPIFLGGLLVVVQPFFLSV
ncbi:MAG: prepilin peptidase [Lachnospiraceae bacterium]|nr:prepilin peptidase [Lachnospiraceae bacterium]